MADLISRHISYRADLQGLRAVAVILVFLFHLWPDSIRGGFIGVDAFFVISGFLITSLLLAEVEKTGRLDLADFWSRRLRRLLPAATLVLLVSLYAALRWLPDTEWINTAKQVFGSALYVQNWMLVAQSVDYLAREASPTVVQHYWSLSIEEQFYFVWPPLLAIAGFFGRLGRGSVRIYAGILILGIFGFSLYLSLFPKPWLGTEYFTTATRAWELALGAFIAVAATKIQVAPAARAVMLAPLNRRLAHDLLDAASIAPKGQEASFASLSYIPLLMSKLATGALFAGIMERYCPATGPRDPGRMWMIVGGLVLMAPLLLLVLKPFIRMREEGKE